VWRFVYLVLAALVSIGCQCASRSDAPSNDQALRRLEEQVRATLGPDWVVSSTGPAELEVVQRKLPAVHNYTSRDPHEVRAILREKDPVRQQALLERWRVNIRYRIVIRLGPELSQKVVDERLVHNRKIRGDLERWEATAREPISLKMIPKNERDYVSIWKQKRDIPCGTYGNRSVYLSITNLGAADANPIIDKQYYAAATAIAGAAENPARRRPERVRLQLVSPHGQNPDFVPVVDAVPPENGKRRGIVEARTPPDVGTHRSPTPWCGALSSPTSPPSTERCRRCWVKPSSRSAAGSIDLGPISGQCRPSSPSLPSPPGPGTLISTTHQAHQSQQATSPVLITRRSQVQILPAQLIAGQCDDPPPSAGGFVISDGAIRGRRRLTIPKTSSAPASVSFALRGVR
jgi:hypothetical protein